MLGANRNEHAQSERHRENTSNHFLVTLPWAGPTVIQADSLRLVQNASIS
jgi:hypothetical protein